jgi:hypothetical protein
VLRAILIALIFVLPTAVLFPQQDVFVSPFGSDSLGTGSAGSPFRTVTRALLVAVNPGDQVVIAAGSYAPADGELFPFVLGDGVSLIGPPGATATLDGTGVFTPIIVVASSAATTRIQNLRVRGAGNVFEIFGNPADLVIRDCTILDGNRGINHDFVGDAAGLTVERCTFLNLRDYGIFWKANAGAPGTHRMTVRDCILVGEELSASGIEFNGVGDVTFLLDIYRNRVEKFSVGLSLILAVTSTEAVIQGTIASNSLVDNDDHGLVCNLSASGAQASGIVMDAEVRDNNLSKNNDHGGSFSLSASGSEATVFLTSLFQGNTVRKNGKSGLFFVESATNGGSCVTAPDLGGGASGSTGGNTLVLNDDEYATGAEYDLRVEADDGISARDNWWVVLTDEEVLLQGLPFLESQFERHIFHFPDTPTSGLVDISGYYLGSLQFDPSPERVVGDGQHPVTLTARPGSAFSTGAGVEPTVLTVEDTTILKFTVTPDGRTLTFTMPVIQKVGGGAVSVRLEHPAGHEGQTTLAVLGDVAGRLDCFVATAAFGNPMAEEVQILRLWRDRFLARSAVGRCLIRAYYAGSPPLARFIARSESRRAGARMLLKPVLELVRLQLFLAGRSAPGSTGSRG